MKKKLNFFISLLLIAVIAFGAFSMPAASFETEVVTSSAAILLVNLDTDTVCYSVEPDRKRYASYMSELMTFIVAAESESAPESRSITVKREFIDELPYSDGSLKLFIGKTLTLKDLMAIMLLGPGSDASYLIADTISGGKVDQFVDKMNQRAAQIGCDRTHFVTPGYSESDQHYTTCRDIYKMFKRLYKLPLYRELSVKPSYIPEGYEDPDAQPDSNVRQKYEIVTQNSLMLKGSPYFFRYTTGGKYSYDPTAKSNYMLTTSYKDMNYIFVAMKGMDSSEQNVFSDGRRLVIWAYLNLADRKVVDDADVVSTFRVAADWGEYDVGLNAGYSAYKTLPTAFEAEKLTYDISIPSLTPLPVFAGQSIGTAAISYDSERIEEVNLISSHAEGVSLLGDVSSFGIYALSEILANDPPADTAAPVSAETPTEQQTVNAEDLE